MIVSHGYDHLNKLGNQQKTEHKYCSRPSNSWKPELKARDRRRFCEYLRVLVYGSPRTIRIWDEAILPAAIFTLSKYAVSNMFKRCADNGHPEIAETLEDFFVELGTLKDQGIITLPDMDDFGISLDEMRSWFEDEEDRNACEVCSNYLDEGYAFERTVLRETQPWITRISYPQTSDQCSSSMRRPTTKDI